MNFIKKKNFSLIFLLLFLCSVAYSQEVTYNVIYKKTIQLKPNKDKPVSSYNKQLMEGTIKELENLEYTLVFNSNEALFKNIESLDSDSNNGFKKVSGVLARNLGIGSGIFYCNVKTKECIKQTELSNPIYLITSSIEDVKWDLVNEVKKIGEYTCYKATSTYRKQTVRSGTVLKEVVAWYTLDLPYPFGPSGYVGLPGLILELEVENTKIYAHKISSEKKEQNIIVPQKGTTISQEEYFELQDKGAARYKSFKN